GISISLDELAIGFSIGLAGVPVAAVVVAIGLQALLAAQLGLAIGAKIGERWRERAEQAAGIALILLGAFLLAQPAELAARHDRRRRGVDHARPRRRARPRATGRAAEASRPAPRGSPSGPRTSRRTARTCPGRPVRSRAGRRPRALRP